MTPRTIHGVDVSGFLVGFDFDGETVADAVAALLALGVRPLRQPVGAAAPPKPQAGAPEPVEQPAPMETGYLDNRSLVFAAQTEDDFDYAVFRLLRGAVFHDVERVAFVRRSIAAAWKPSERTNRAMWIALETYHEKRGLAAGWGEAETAAHQFARREAVTAYNNAIKG